MYGIEAQATGSGGLMAQTPYPDMFLPGAMAVGVSPRSLVGTGLGGNAGPYDMPINTTVAVPVAQAPMGAQQQGWRSVLDWHNSPAIWILAMILLLYGWLHFSLAAKAGRARAGLTV
jgi:hypothetical protein